MIPALKRHVEQSGKHKTSWLEVALERGAIVPFVREEVQNFPDIVKRLIRDKFPNISPQDMDFVNSIGKRVSKMQVWPTVKEYNFGLELARSSKATFLPDVAPTPEGLPEKVASEVENFWGSIREWRTSWIPEAIRQRRRDSGPDEGLRLTDVVQAADRDLFHGKGKEIKTSSDLLKKAERVLSVERIRYLRAFLILLDDQWSRNYCHGMNQCGISLGLTTPRWHPVTSLLAVEMAHTAPGGMGPRGESEVLKDLRVRLPSLKVLRETSAEVLEDIWKNGEDYFSALERWRQNPSKCRTEKLAEKLDSYSRMVVSKTHADRNFCECEVMRVSLGDLVQFLGTLGGIMALSSVKLPASAGPTVQATVSFVFSCLVLKPLFKCVAKKRTQVRASVEFRTGVSFGESASQITKAGKLFGPGLDVSFRGDKKNN
jgi:hypothetical protein